MFSGVIEMENRFEMELKFKKLKVPRKISEYSRWSDFVLLS